MVCGTTLMALIFTGIYMFVNMDIIGDKNGSTMAISRWIYGCEIFAIFCSIICFIPQFNMSKQFQIVIGVDIIHLFFQLLGACSLFCLIFFVTLQKNDYKVDSYATFRDVITVEVRQIVQSVFIIIAVLLLFIQLLWYWKMPTPDEIIEKINESKKDLNANARQHRQLHNVTNGGRGGRGGRGNASAGRGGRGTGSSGRGRGSPRTSTVSSPSVASSNNIRTSQPSTPPVLNARNLALNNPSGAVAFSANGTPTHSVLPVGSNGRRTSIATPGTPGAEAHSAAIPRWKCHICTFSNEAGNFFCLMCETQMEVNNPTPANGANV